MVVSDGRPTFGEDEYVVPLCDGGAVVVDARTLEAAFLNPVAALLRARLRAGVTDLDALVAAVAAEFDAPDEAIEADVRRFVAELGPGFCGGSRPGPECPQGLERGPSGRVCG